MKIYNAFGYGILMLYLVACAWFAPPQLGPWLGIVIGVAYFGFFWFLAGVYLADVLHLGIAHRSLDFKDRFIKVVVLFNNFLGVYVDPIAWVNRHRLHHKYSDHEGDPNKLASDGFWRTLYLCIVPYPCDENLAVDKIFKSWPFQLVSNNTFAALSPIFSLAILWLLVRDWKFALVMFLGLRIFAVWVNMIQNYWTHTRIYGTRRYPEDQDNAMNISEWLPVTATFSACLQNNHHHSPGLLRLSHSEAEYDFGFMTVRLMERLGIVRATERGAGIPDAVPLASPSRS